MDNTNKRFKKKHRSKKFKKIMTILSFIILFLLWSIYILLNSDLLNLKTVEIYGNEILEEEEIIETGKIIFNRNILQFKLTELENNIISHPYIKEVNIKRKLPQTLTITVREREKYAIIPYMGSYIYIDQDKVVLESSDSYLAEDLVLITGVEFESFKLGHKVDIKNTALLDRAIELVAASKVINNAEMISEINIGQEDYIKLITFDGIEVLLSKSIDPVYAMLAFKETLTNIYTRNIDNIIVDMRYDGQISIRNREIWEEE
ncbi:MAG: FtsQ-type POTRA domain-containing protein [Clostridiales bacterium]|nr:FtsQ-type POTRA domain-containing protein [Clostridiales bacterium]